MSDFKYNSISRLRVTAYFLLTLSCSLCIAKDDAYSLHLAIPSDIVGERFYHCRNNQFADVDCEAWRSGVQSILFRSQAIQAMLPVGPEEDSALNLATAGASFSVSALELANSEYRQCVDYEIGLASPFNEGQRAAEALGRSIAAECIEVAAKHVMRLLEPRFKFRAKSKRHKGLVGKKLGGG